jgi:hypothetical protein
MFKVVIRKDLLILLILFLGVSGFLGNWSIYIVMSIYLILIISINTIRYFDAVFWWLVVFSVTYTLGFYGYYENPGYGAFFWYILYPPLFYILGVYFADRSTSKTYILWILLLLIIGYSFLYIKNAIVDTINFGLINYRRSIIVNDNSQLGAYYQQVRSSLAISGIGLLFVPTYSKEEKYFKLLYLTISCLGIFSALHFVNREGIVIACSCAFFAIISQIKKKSSAIYIVSIGLLFIFFINFLLHEIKIQPFFEAYQNREINLESNFWSLGGRLERWGWVLGNMLYHPFGKIISNKYGYAHNLWLDSARVAGLIPFLALCIVTFSSLKKAIKLLYKKKDTTFFDSILISLNVTFLLQCFVEPILESDSFFFLLYVMVCGMQNFLFRSPKLAEKKLLNHISLTVS